MLRSLSAIRPLWPSDVPREPLPSRLGLSPPRGGRYGSPVPAADREVLAIDVSSGRRRGPVTVDVCMADDSGGARESCSGLDLSPRGEHLRDALGCSVSVRDPST